MLILCDIETERIGSNRVQNKKSKHTILKRDNIYAGCVMVQKNKYSKVIPCRKIIFSMNQDGTINDLLYDSPNYLIESTNNQKFYISDIVKLEKLLESYSVSEYMNNSEITYILDYFLSKHSTFFKEDHRYLPMTLKEYATLEVLSKLRKRPTIEEKKELKKIKTYTFK